MKIKLNPLYVSIRQWDHFDQRRTKTPQNFVFAWHFSLMTFVFKIKLCSKSYKPKSFKSLQEVLQNQDMGLVYDDEHPFMRKKKQIIFFCSCEDTLNKRVITGDGRNHLYTYFRTQQYIFLLMRVYSLNKFYFNQMNTEIVYAAISELDPEGVHCRTSDLSTIQRQIYFSRIQRNLVYRWSHETKNC